MSTQHACPSAVQLIAYELASHELSRLLDDCAHVIWRARGEATKIGRLAEDARWAAFLLHDRIAAHAVREGGVARERLAVRAMAPGDLALSRPNQICSGTSGTASDLGKVAAALTNGKAALIGIHAGYGSTLAETHPLLKMLISAHEALDALRDEVEEERARAGEPRARGGARVRRTTARGVGTGAARQRRRRGG